MTEQDLEKISDAPEVRTRDIFQKMDTNSDGVLSQEEFVRGCMNDDTLYKLLACSEDDDAHWFVQVLSQFHTPPAWSRFAPSRSVSIVKKP